MWIFALFLALPLIEITLFVTVGAWLTLWPTLAIVLGSAVLGVALVRWQGLGLLRDLQGNIGSMQDPVSPLAHGALILLGGFLLILPGFFTDTLGLLLLIPPLRSLLIQSFLARMRLDRFQFQTTGFSARGGFARDPEGDWVDAEFEEIAPKSALPQGGPQKPSGWTRH